MNTQANHPSDELLERYAMDALSEHESAPLEEHLLLCQCCQARLATADEFLEVMQAALATPPDPPAPKKKRVLAHTA